MEPYIYQPQPVWTRYGGISEGLGSFGPHIALTIFAIVEYSVFMLLKWMFSERKILRWSLFVVLTGVNMLFCFVLKYFLSPTPLPIYWMESWPVEVYFLSDIIDPPWLLAVLTLFIGAFFLVRELASKFIPRLTTPFQHSIFAFYSLFLLLFGGIFIFLEATLFTL